MNQFLSGYRRGLRSAFSTMFLCTKQLFDGHLFMICGGYAVQGVQFLVLISIWKALAVGGSTPGGMALSQLLTYSLMSAILHPELNVTSPATASLWEGSIIGRFTRPLPVPVSFVAETIGKRWIPHFLFFGLPLWCISPLLGINPLPASLAAGVLALLSLILSAFLGFAIDLLFAAFAMFLKNGCWAAMDIREAVYSLLSGEMIPFALFPLGLGQIFALLPMGSVAHAPLAIYTGSAGLPLFTIGLQLFWNVALWWAAAVVLKKSKERMISFGG